MVGPTWPVLSHFRLFHPSSLEPVPSHQDHPQIPELHLLDLQALPHTQVSLCTHLPPGGAQLQAGPAWAGSADPRDSEAQPGHSLASQECHPAFMPLISFKHFFFYSWSSTNLKRHMTPSLTIPKTCTLQKQVFSISKSFQWYLPPYLSIICLYHDPFILFSWRNYLVISYSVTKEPPPLPASLQ